MSDSRSVSLQNLNFILFILLVFCSFYTGCSSTSNGGTEPAEGPYWIMTPPVSQDSIYGIGCGSSEKEAKELAMVNAAQQFSCHVKSVMVAREGEGLGEEGSVMQTFDRQITDYTLTGAKYVEKYVDDKHQTWVLVEAPLNCLLDGTESILISHILATLPAEDEASIPAAQVQETEEEGLSVSQDPLERVRELRSALRGQIAAEVNEVLAAEKIQTLISEAGYVEPGYLVAYNRNGGAYGNLPVDRKVYSSGDLTYVMNPGTLSKDYARSWKWTTRPDGGGAVYQYGSIIRVGESDTVLYAYYSDDGQSSPGFYPDNVLLPENRTITVDGMMEDWVGVPSVFPDNPDDTIAGQTEGSDIGAVYFAYDDENLYIMVRTTSLPLDLKNRGYYFNFASTSKNSIIYYDLYHLSEL